MNLRALEKWLNISQAAAALGLFASYFLPFYRSTTGDVSYMDEWGLFAWPIPVVFILYKLSNRWLKALFGGLASLGGGFTLFLLTFAATFKRTPLVGFEIARVAIIILILNWLALIVVAFLKHARQRRGSPASML